MGIGEWERFSHVAMRIKGLSQQRRTGNGTSGKLNQFGTKIDKKSSISEYISTSEKIIIHNAMMSECSRLAYQLYTAAARHARGAAI